MKTWGALLLCVFLTSCATGSSIVTGAKRAPIDPSQVKVLLQAPPNHEVIGLVQARSLGGMSDQAKQDYALEELKSQAAALGANAIVLSTTGTEVTTGATYIPNAAGGGTFIPIQGRHATLSAQAIYIEP